MNQDSGEGPPLDFGAVAAESPGGSVRNELEAAAPDTKDLPADTAGVVSPDHSQADPGPEASDVLPRDQASVAPD